MKQTVQGAGPSAKVHEILCGIAQPPDVFVLHEQAHQPVTPFYRQCRQLEETQQVSGRRGINNDACVASLLESVAQRRERIQLIDARRCERQQVAENRAIVHHVTALSHEGVE